MHLKIKDRVHLFGLLIKGISGLADKWSVAWVTVAILMEDSTIKYEMVISMVGL